jgi:predicted acylesterase/phospholipase RssA
MASEHVTRICQRAFGDHMIEDLWLPYFCVSTNMSTAEPVYHQRGLLWRAIRASMAIPGVFLPLTENDDVLVDGGAMDNFPVRKTIELCETEHVIGVHVSPYKERKRQYDYDTSLSGWRILFSRINPFQKPLRTPSFLDTMMRAAEVGGVRNGKADEQAVSLLIHPDVRGFDPTNYRAYQKLAQVGYEAAVEPLQEWQRHNLSWCRVKD